MWDGLMWWRLSSALAWAVLCFVGATEAKTIVLKESIPCEAKRLADLPDQTTQVKEQRKRASYSCSLELMRRIEKRFGLTLMAVNPGDVVNGSLSIRHTDPHEIVIELYEQDELPNSKHDATLKKPIVLPPDSDLDEEVRHTSPDWQGRMSKFDQLKGVLVP